MLPVKKQVPSTGIFNFKNSTSMSSALIKKTGHLFASTTSEKQSSITSNVEIHNIPRALLRREIFPYLDLPSLIWVQCTTKYLRACSDDKVLNAKIEFAYARKIAEQIKLLLSKVKALVTIAQEQVKVGLVSEAKNTLALAKTTAERLEDPFSKVKALVAIAQEQVKVGLVSEAKDTLALAKTTAERL